MAITTEKFQRDYLLQVQRSENSSETISITPPLSLEFDINRNVFSDANTGKFTIYNLAPETRAALYHDRYRIYARDYQKIQMFGGYNTSRSRPLIFLGNVFTAVSQRVGPDWKTTIEAFDGGVGLLTGHIKLVKPAGWNVQDLARSVAGTMDYVQFGALGDVAIKNSRAVAMSGSSFEIFRRLVGDGLAFVDNGKLFGIGENEYLMKPGETALVLNPGNILGTPLRGEGYLEVNIVFEPGVFIGQLANLTSQEAVYNGQYQVRGIRHRGVISEAVCGEAITTLTLWTGGQTLRPVTVR